MVPKMPCCTTLIGDCLAALSRPLQCRSMRASRNWASWSGLVAALTLLAPPVIVRADPESDSELKEVVVTAQRQSERSHDVPIALTAVSADELHDRGSDRPRISRPWCRISC